LAGLSVDGGLPLLLCSSNADYLQHEKLQALIHLAFTSTENGSVAGSKGGAFNPRRTISVNPSLMWKILQFSFFGDESRLPGSGLFHESFCPDGGHAEHDEGHTVETQIFHNPTAEVDTSDGGQALPPYAAISGNTSPTHQRNPRQAEGGRGHDHGDMPEDGRRHVVTDATGDTAGGPMLYAPFMEVPSAAAPWAFPGNASSVMDVMHDPYFQFQNPGSPFYGTWEVGNL
jgi:hypothetical protein